MFKMIGVKVVFAWMSIFALANARNCVPSRTTVSGTNSVPGKICSGRLIFEEIFETLDMKRWQHDVTLGGDRNGQFQWFDREGENSYVKDGQLHLKPTLTADRIGYDDVEHGHVQLTNCTDSKKENCQRHADGNIIINPIRSARLNTRHSFSFRYGRIEIVAKMPTGDWLWPAIRLLPTHSRYGEWPRSGEIDLLESRGNRDYKDHSGINIGVEHVSSTLHFGSRFEDDAFMTASYSRDYPSGYHDDFHKYEYVWSESGIRFSVDGSEIGYAAADKGFWKHGGLTGHDIWASSTKMAPFDEEFHFIVSLAVGGNNGYFPDIHHGYKPWKNSSPTAMKDFWLNRKHWLPTWDLYRENSTLIVDSIKVWAL